MTANLTPATTVLVDSGVIAKGQGYGSTRIYAVELHNGQTAKIRVIVDRNSYDFESRHLAEVWTPNGWMLVTTVAGNDPGAAAMPSYTLYFDRLTTRKGHESCVAAAEAMCARLLADALLVLA